MASPGLGLGASATIDRERDDDRRTWCRWCGRGTDRDVDGNVDRDVCGEIDQGVDRDFDRELAHVTHRTEGVSQPEQTGGMELIEIEDEHRVTREEAAKWLHRLADSLERHNEVEFVREGLRMRIDVPAEVTMEVELEIGDESSLEIELSW